MRRGVVKSARWLALGMALLVLADRASLRVERTVLARDTDPQTTDERKEKSPVPAQSPIPPACPQFFEKLASRTPVTVACLGDSVTGVYYHTGGRRAYPEMLGEALHQASPDSSVKIINAGISGNTTADGLARLRRDVLDHHPQLVTVMFGLNDMVRVPLADFQANLRQITQKCRDAGAEVLFCTPNAVIDTPGRPISKLLEYCQAMHSTGKEIQVPVCDCRAAHEQLRERDALGWRLTLSDEIHPNMDGHKLTAVAICKSLTGKSVSLNKVGPIQPVLIRTARRGQAKEPLRIIAMAPCAEVLKNAIAKAAPDFQIELTAWPTAEQSLAQLQEAAKRIREQKYDLVVICVPSNVTPSLAAPPESAISSYSWILNWSLSFGHQEWDVIGISPALLAEVPTPQEVEAEKFARQMFAAQDLVLVQRQPGEKSATVDLLAEWLRGQWNAK
jgi:lysophospholipase L1-like esterase